MGEKLQGIRNIMSKYNRQGANKNSIRNQVAGNMEAIDWSGVHFPLAPVKHLADLKNRANSQQYSSIYGDQRPKIEDIERSDGKKSP